MSTTVLADVTNHMPATVIPNPSASIEPSDGEQEPVFFHLAHATMQRTPSEESVIQVQLTEEDSNGNTVAAISDEPTNGAIDRSDHNVHSSSRVENGEEMILTAATLGSHLVPSTSATTFSLPIGSAVSLCWAQVLGEPIVCRSSVFARETLLSFRFLQRAIMLGMLYLLSFVPNQQWCLTSFFILFRIYSLLFGSVLFRLFIDYTQFSSRLKPRFDTLVATDPA